VESVIKSVANSGVEAIGGEVSEELELDLKTRKIYNSWRVRVLLSVILGYATYYLCRQNFSMIMPAFMEEYGYTKTQLGWMLTAASIVYAIGKFVNGYISDRSNARYFMVFGLLSSSVLTFFMGFSESLLYLAIFFILNNWVQSMGWPPVARVLTHWFAQKELGTKWAYGAASHQVGGAFTIIFSGYLVTEHGWRYAFFVPGIIACIIALFLFNRLRESPEELGLPKVETYKNQSVNPHFSSEDEEENISTSEIFSRVFMNRKMWYVSIANMFVYVVRLGVIYWAPLFLQEYKSISLSMASWQVASYELAGLLGGFSAGWASDKIFKGQRGLIGAMYMFMLAVSLSLFWYLPAEDVFLGTLLMISIGFFVYGPQVLVGVASADFASKKAIGTANGFAGTMGYLGSALSGVCVGWLSDNYDWGAVFIFFIISAILGGVFFLLTMLIIKKESAKK
jgi:OPA family glycerol-3-phosphate transporter-like MFS transporter